MNDQYSIHNSQITMHNEVGISDRSRRIYGFAILNDSEGSLNCDRALQIVNCALCIVNWFSGYNSVTISFSTASRFDKTKSR